MCFVFLRHQGSGLSSPTTMGGIQISAKEAESVNERCAPPRCAALRGVYSGILQYTAAILTLGGWGSPGLLARAFSISIEEWV